MPYPTKLLHDDEDLLIDAHPHWIRLVRPIVFAAVVLGGCGYGFVDWSSAPTWFGALLGVVMLGTAVVVVSKVLYWRSTHLVVTSHRVVTRSGVLRRVGREIPIGRVQDVTYHQSLSERMVGVGTVVIESAGKSGDETFVNVRRPEFVQSVINRAQANAQFTPPSGRSRRRVREFYDDGVDSSDDHYGNSSTDRYPPAPPTSAALAPMSLAQRLDQLTDLLHRGIVTEAEFAEKRAELLGE